MRYDGGRTGALGSLGGSDVVVDLVAVLEETRCVGWVELIRRWAELSPRLRDLVDAPPTDVIHELHSVKLEAPLPTPCARIFALGVNFRSHVASAAHALDVDDPTASIAGRPPAGFFVIPGTVVGPDEDVAPPRDAQKLDYEAEVAVVLATGGRNLSPGKVAVWGYTGYNDLSIRDPHLGLSRLDEGTLAWGLQKNFDGGNVLGPSVTVGEDHDLTNLSIRSTVNGQTRQDGSTAEMIRSFAEVAAYLSQYVRLQPGDMLTSGTPAGTAIERGIDGPFLVPGDVVEVQVEGAGILRTRIVAPTASGEGAAGTAYGLREDP